MKKSALPLILATLLILQACGTVAPSKALDRIERQRIESAKATAEEIREAADARRRLEYTRNKR